MEFRQLSAIIAGAFSLQCFRINRLFLDAHRCVIGDHARQHQRQNNLIIKRDLEDHHDRHDGSVGGRSEKCAHPDECKRTGIDRKMSEQMVCACPEQKSEACSDEQRRREHSTHCARTESSSGGKYFENEDDRECLPKPFTTQNPAYDTVAIAADFRMRYGQPTYDKAANTHLYVNRRRDSPSPFFSCTQQPNEPWREETGAKPEQKIGSNLPIAVELECRDLVQRIWSEKSPDCQCRDDRRKDQRAENFHGHGAQHNPCDKYRARDWSVVSRCDTGSRATAHEQSKSRRGPFLKPSPERCDQR